MFRTVAPRIRWLALLLMLLCRYCADGVCSDGPCLWDFGHQGHLRHRVHHTAKRHQEQQPLLPLSGPSGARPEILVAFAVLISCQGFGWLVRNGSSYLNQSAEREGLDHSTLIEVRLAHRRRRLLIALQEAPRTVLAVMPNGTLVFIQVDGVESTKRGACLAEVPPPHKHSLTFQSYPFPSYPAP